MNEIVDWIASTRLSWVVNTYGWIWPTAETLHFCALALIAGAVGLLDLRLLGVVKGLSPVRLRGLAGWAFLGLGVSAATGVLFIAGAPDQYFFNRAFHVKAAALALAGVNVLAFYALVAPRLEALGPDDDAPGAAKVIAALSLGLLVVIMCAGRMLTFFRPLYI
ncbi:MAG TPA: DUF6644 family protein [Gammaproteobacteria bacterium]